MIKPYQPSNGTEGMGFIEIWCFSCKKDENYRKGDYANGCQIVADTFAYNVDDPLYPKEWQYCTESHRSWCTAHEPIQDT